MKAAKKLDCVVGTDTHLVIIPSGAVVPIPMPFFGMFLVTGAPTVQITGRTGANVGSVAINLPPHLPMPGVAFVIPPSNDAESKLGSLTVLTQGKSALRQSDPMWSCNDPVRLPTSLIASGAANVLIGGALGAGGGGGGGGGGGAGGGGGGGSGRGPFSMMRVERPRIRYDQPSSEAEVAEARRAPDNAGSAEADQNSTFTGHPVDVVTGRVITTKRDFVLRGPLRYEFVRRYDSSLSWRKGALGYGWSHPFEQTIRHGAFKRVWKGDDGREIEFDLSQRPGRTLVHGDAVYDAVARATLYAWDGERYTVETADGVLREFAPIANGEIALVRIRRRDKVGLTLAHDGAGRLASVTDSGGRQYSFEHDAEGRLVRISLPNPDGDGQVEHMLFAYENDDLVATRDALGAWDRNAYKRHLLVEETDRAGLTFHFQYDGLGPRAKCVRTWGSGGIFDHELVYGPAITVVTDSLEHKTVYRIAEGRVVERVDARGGSTKYEFHPVLGHKTAEIDATGARTTFEHDERGNRVRKTFADGGEIVASYKGDLLREVKDVMGGRSRRSYDSYGRLVRRHDALERTTRFEWQGGVVSRIDHPSGAITTLEYDAQRALARTTLDGGSGGAISTFYRHDGRGRLIERRDARGAVRTWKYDLLDRVIEIGEPDGSRRTFTYDLAGNVVEARDRQRTVVYRYGGFHRLSAIEEAGSRVVFHYDTEERLVAVENEAGETYRYTLDATGLPIEETGFDGETTRFDRDAAGRVVRMVSPSGKSRALEYDEVGRLSKIRYDDDTWRRFRWRRDGLLAEATNADVRVRFERDARGRIVREWQDERWLASTYDPAGACVRVESSTGCVQRFGRDLLGRVLGVEIDGTDVTPIRIELVRDVLGAELERRVNRRTVLRHERDLLGRPVLRSARFSDRGSSELRYEWDGRRIAAIADSDEGLTSFDFDARGRLAGARSRSRDGARVLDAAGNVFRRRDFLDRRYGRGGRVEKTEEAELGWDRDGNLVGRKTARGATSYSYRGDGLLGAVDLPDGTRVELRYDALGRRTKKIVSRLENGEPRQIRTVSWSWNASVPFEEHASAPERDGDPVRWVFEPETFAPLARLERGRTHAVLADHLGTPREMVDAEGRLAWRMTLDPFGLPISESRPQGLECPFRFPGQYADEETGLYYNRHRYYSPSLGSYERPDPIALEGGLRLYGYVSDPTRQIDPYGLCEPSSAASHDGTVNAPGASRTSGNVWGDGGPQGGGGNVWGDGEPQGGTSGGNVWDESEASVAKPSEPEAGGNVWGENPSSADEPSQARETGAVW